jgi:hypothetical protein
MAINYLDRRVVIARLVVRQLNPYQTSIISIPSEVGGLI